MLCLHENINQARLIISFFWSFHHVVWPQPGCLILMPARGLGLNLGYAKNEADRGSRHRSLASCPIKTISYSYSVSFSFMIPLLSYFLTLTQLLLSPSLQALLLFFLWEYVGSLFLTLSEQGAGRWNLFYGTENALYVIPTEMFVGWHRSEQPAKCSQSGLVIVPVTLS